MRADKTLPGESLALNSDAIRRALTRIAHELLERHPDTERLVLVGMRTRGAPLAERIASAIFSFESQKVHIGAIDISLHRDDLAKRGTSAAILPSDLPDSIEDQVVVLVDDVLYTGRSIRAALDTLVGYGRPAAIELAVLIDRGHRELPIKADYVGKNLPTNRNDDVIVRLQEIDGIDEVIVVTK